ncbi:DUF2490 domain-containing protein [Pedobacter sp. LMG 31464]|uniref:DUF2490 domain-containing protein n=1 Tax=Pedobacter planticolens TaxID=2679964 RepID=A0A923E1P8_9SPHI|nr:DUF2490 domain-containing protein [Pedobacter planticolens]MBB2146768.1 DUF2490 domain-containing protein [Pedobacter planticolens]
MKKLALSLLLFMAIGTISAQTNIQNSGWLGLFNSTKFNEKWGFAFDAQFRSSDNWEYVRNVLIRPGITYYINNKNNVTAGYLYTTTYNKLVGTSNNTLTEHRAWEQYVLSHKLRSSFVSHRFRLEQRFIEQANGDEIFAQRFRYFVRLIQPLQGNVDVFNEGAFVALQNEVFFNIQNKEKLNNSLFDQNRFYIAGGYRFSKKVDIEAGYLNQYTNGIARNTSNRVAQLALYTRF